MKMVCMSDLHGFMPDVEECDLLIIGGDVCPDLFGGKTAKRFPELQLAWFQNVWVPYILKQPARFIIMTWGNHDFCGHLKPNATYDRLEVICDGEYRFKDKRIWLSPWSNEFMDWAWMDAHDALGKVYERIPEGIDILVSHQPPYGCGDLYVQPAMKNGMECWSRQHIGSSELRFHVERVKPEIVICGHLHKGYGWYEIPHEGAVAPTRVANVSVVNEKYELVNEPTIIEVN